MKAKSLVLKFNNLVNMKESIKSVTKFSFIIFCALFVQVMQAEGTRELLVDKNLTYDSSKFKDGEFFGIQIWDQDNSARKSGTYQTINAADQIYRIKIRICNLGEIINLGFNQPNFDVFFRLYKPDGTTVQFNDNTIAANGDAGPSVVEQGTAGAPFSYRVPRLYSITSATNANPIVITTSSAHEFVSGNVVSINGVAGNTNANGTYFVKVTSTTKFELYTNAALTTGRAGNAAHTANTGSARGAGYIDNYGQAAVGPAGGEASFRSGLAATYNTLTGYRPLQHRADQTGDYYIVFNGGNADNQNISKRIFSIFDITVWNSMASKTQQKGRLFCAAWDINCGGLNDPKSQFNSKMYFYSKDSVITAVRFNQMRPYGFAITANSRGCASTSNALDDRKSRIMFNGYPEYPIFFNTPYDTVTSTGTCGFAPKTSFGNVLSSSITGCDNDRCINIMVDKSATIGVTLLPVAGATGAQNFTPRLFPDMPISANSNTCIPWDGKDGAGNKITGPVQVRINYYNGLTNLPLFDVEEHRFGYRIDLIAPKANPGAKNILVYWDDRPPASETILDFQSGEALDGYFDLPTPGQITTNIGNAASLNVKHSTYDFFGCDPSVDHNTGLADIQGCHLWASRGLNPTVTAPNNLYETHNTWWNANVIDITLTYIPSNIEVYAMKSHAPGPLGSAPYAGTPNDTNICSNLRTMVLNPVVRRETTAGSGTYVNHTGTWTIKTGTGTFQSTGSATSSTLNDTYLISDADTARGYVTLRITSEQTALTPCGTANDTMRILIKRGPRVAAGPNQSVCLNNNNAIVTLAGSIGGSTATYQWNPSVAGGTFVPNAQTLNATYQPPASVTNSPTVATSITLTLTSLTTNTGAVVCPVATSPMVITYNAVPLVDATVGAPACNTASNIPVSATINGSGTVNASFPFVWSGAGTFSSTTTTLSPTYTPTAAERAAGTATVTISVTKTSAPACNAVSDQATITLITPPTVDAGNGFQYCNNRTDTIGLSGTVNGAFTSTTWTCITAGATGSFMGTENSLTAKYKPSASDLTKPSLTFRLTATSATCGPITDDVVITLYSPSTVNAGSDKSTCKNVPCVSVNASITGSSTGSWSSSGAGTFTPSVNSTSITYCLTDAELNLGVALIQYKIPSDGNCLADQDSVLIFISPAPKPNAGTAKTVCENNAVVTLSDATGNPGSTVTWSSLSTTPGNFNNANAVNPQYTLSNAEINAGSATLVMSMVTGGCAAETDTVVISVTGSPTVDAGTGPNVCVNNPVTTLTGTVSAGTPSWTVFSGTTGTFGSALAASTTFTATSPTAGGTTVLRLTTSLAGCADVFDDVTISYTSAPSLTVATASSATVCKSNPNVNLIATPTPVNAPVVWTRVSPGVAGIFSPSADSVETTYIPSSADLSAGSVTLQATIPSFGNCSAVTSSNQVVITYVEIPTANAGNNVTLCENTLSAVNISGSFTALPAPLTITGQTWSSSSGCSSCFNSTTAASTSYTPSTTDASNGFVILTLTSTNTATGCLPVQDTMKITILKAPSVDAGPDLVVCTNQNTVTLNGSASNMASVTWTVPTGSGTFSNSASAITTYNITALDKSNGTAIVRLTANGNSPCAGMPDDVVIKFTDLPVIEAGPAKTVCVNDLPIQLDGSGAAGTWSTATAGTFTPGNTTANATFQPTSTATATITFTYSIAASGGCPAVSDNVSISLIQAPSITQANTYGICAASASSVNVSAAATTGAGFWTSTGTGSFANSTATATTYTPSASDFNAGSVILTFETTNNGFCSAVTDTAKLFLTNLSFTAGPDQNKCGSTVGSTFTSTATLLLNGVNTPGLIGNWTVVSGSGGVSGTSTVTYTLGAGDVPVAPLTTSVTLRATTNGVIGACPVITDNVIFTLQDAPDVTATAAADACETATAIPVSGTIVGAPSGTWSHNGGGTFSPNNVFNAGQTSVNYIPAAADTNLTTIRFTLTTDPTLCGNVSQFVDVNLDDRTKVYAGPDITLCANNNVRSLSSATIGNGGTGVWKSSNGCMACFTGGTNFPAATAYDADTANVTNGFVTLTLTSNPIIGNACPIDSDKVVISFSTAPDVNAGPDRTICGNNRTLNISGTVNAPFTAVWTTLPTGGTFGSATSVMANTYTASNADTTAGTATIILSSVDAAGLCAVDDDTILVTITDAPVIDVGAATLSACADTFFVKLNANSNLSANPIGTWSGGTGSFLNMNASSDTAVYVPSAAERAAAPTSIKLKFTTASGFCLPASDSVTINLLKAPTVDVTSGGLDSTTLCANATTISLNAAITDASGITWSTTGNGTFTPSTTSTTPTYTIGTLDKAAGVVTLTAITTGNGNCFSARDQFKLRLQALPVVEAGSDVNICQTTSSVSLSDATVTNAGGGLWTTSGTGVFGATNTTVNGTYFPSNCCFGTIDTAQTTITLTLTSTSNGLCPAATDTKSITFTKSPVVSAGNDVTICADSLKTTLTATRLRSSGITWTALDGGTFAASSSIDNPVFSPTGVGTFRAVATAAGMGTCSPVRDTVVITVRSIPVISLGAGGSSICAVGENPTLQYQVSTLTLTNATGVTWSSSTGGTFDLTDPLKPVYLVNATDLTNGIFNINAVTSSGIGVCQPKSAQISVTINKAPIADAGPDLQVCAETGGTSVGLAGTLTNSNNGSWSSDATGLVFSDPNGTHPTYTLTPIPSSEDDPGDVITFTYTAIGQGSCPPSSDVMTVTYIANPVLNAGGDLQACFNTNADILAFQLNGGGGLPGTWTTTDDAAPTFTPSANDANAIYTPSAGELTDGNTITLTFTTTDVCYITDPTDDIIITLHQTPELNTAAAADLCEGTATQNLSTAVMQGASGVQWSILQGFGTLSNSTTTGATYNVNASDKTLDSIVVIVTATASFCPQDVDTVAFTVVPAPTSDEGADQTVCSDLLNVANAIQLSGTASNVASITWSSANGSFSNANDLNSTFTATSFPATITLTAMGNAPCANVPKNLVISATNAPVVVTLTSKDTCAKLSPVNLSSVYDATSSSGFTTAQWSVVQNGTQGTFFPNTSTITGQYLPSAADTARGFVDLVLTATNTGVCSNTYDDTVRFNFDRQPFISAGADLTFCAQNKLVFITGTATNAADGVIWATNGTGTFMPTNNATTIYTISSLDSLNGGAILSISTTNGATISCPDVTDFVPLTLTPAPVAIVNAGLDQFVCSDNVSTQLNGFILNATGGLWTIADGSGSFSDSTSLTTTYTFSAADKLQDTIRLVLQSVGQDALCQPTVDTIQIILTPTPDLIVIAPPSVCASNPTIQLGDSISAPSTNLGIWTTEGDGVFSPNEFDVDAQYFPGPVDIASGRVGFTLTSISNGTCIGDYFADTLTTITPFIVATASATDDVCANDPNGKTLDATSSTGTGIWKVVTDDGTVLPQAPSGISTLFKPGANDILNQAATLRFVTTGSVCAPDSVQVLITVNPAPTVTVLPDMTLCADVINGGLSVRGDITIATSGSWRTTGTGSFFGTSSSGTGTKTISTTYIPSSDDTLNGSVTLILASVGNQSGASLCAEEDDSITITFMPRPAVSLSAPNTCTNMSGIRLSGSVSQDAVFYPASYGQWSSSGSGVFVPDAFDPTATYVPSGSDLAIGKTGIYIRWSSQGAGSCDPVTDSIHMYINTPIASAGPDQFTCNNASVVLTAVPDASAASYAWATTPGNVAAGTGLSVPVTTAATQSYVLTLTDIYGCQATDTVTVNNLNIPALSISNNPCYDYYLYLKLLPQPTGLNPQGTILWSYEGLAISGADGNKDSVRVQSPGDFTVDYSLGSCRVNFGTHTVFDVPRVLTPDVIACTNALANVEVFPVHTPANIVSFTWTDTLGNAQGTGNPRTLMTSAADFDTITYFVAVVDANGCSDNDSVDLISVPVPEPFLTDDSMACVGSTITLDASIHPSSNINSLLVYGLQSEWYDTSAVGTILGTNVSIDLLISGTYVYRGTVGQCVGDDTTDLLFQPYPAKILPSDTTICMDQLKSITLNAGTGVSGIPELTDLNYLWSGFGATPADTNQQFTVLYEDFTDNKSEDNTYLVDITAEYSYLQCAVTDTINVHDVCAPRLFPPTAFHPGDPNSMDAFFTIQGKYFKDFNIKVFSRWGEIIFQSDDINVSWDGTYRGELLPVGVYAYTISYVGKSEEYSGPFVKDGRIVLIR